MSVHEKTVGTALGKLKQAVERLDNAVDGRFERERASEEVEREVRIAHEDRMKLAQELDICQLRANRLEEVNSDVSRRLVAAMETMRAILDR